MDRYIPYIPYRHRRRIYHAVLLSISTIIITVLYIFYSIVYFTAFYFVLLYRHYTNYSHTLKRKIDMCFVEIDDETPAIRITEYKKPRPVRASYPRRRRSFSSASSASSCSSDNSTDIDIRSPRHSFHSHHSHHHAHRDSHSHEHSRSLSPPPPVSFSPRHSYSPKPSYTTTRRTRIRTRAETLMPFERSFWRRPSREDVRFVEYMDPGEEEWRRDRREVRFIERG